jgi:serine protease Do
MRALPRLVARTPIDKTVDVEVRRKGEKKTLRVTIGRLADDEARPKALSGAPNGEAPQSEMSVLGLKLSRLNDKLRSKYGFGADVTGAIVSEVDPESPAAKRIRPGDVIVEAAQEPVTDPQDIARKVEDVKRSGGKTVQLGVEDALGGYRFIAIPVQ